MLLSRDGTVPCVKSFWITWIVFGELGLRSLLKEYVEYFNQNRPHQSLEQDSPCTKHGKIDFDRTKIQRERLVDGLIVDYSIAA